MAGDLERGLGLLEELERREELREFHLAAGGEGRICCAAGSRARSGEDTGALGGANDVEIRFLRRRVAEVQRSGVCFELAELCSAGQAAAPSLRGFPSCVWSRLHSLFTSRVL